VRCEECKTDPLTPGHFCECCGRKLSLQERRALEIAQPDASAPAAVPAPELSEPAAHADGRADRLIGVHFAEPAPAETSAPAVHTPGPGFLDPILEAHFAGQAPAEPVPPPAPAPVAAVAAAPRKAATTDWAEPAAKVAPSAAIELYTDPVVDDAPSHGDVDASFPRCEVCSGPTEDGDLCATCRATFHSLLETPAPAQPTPAPAPQTVESARADAGAPTVAAVEPAVAAAVVPEAVVDPVIEPAVGAPVEAAAVVAAPPDKVEVPAPLVQPPAPIQIKVRPPIVPAPEPAPEAAAAPAQADARPSRPQASKTAATPKAAPPRASSPAPAAPPPSNSRRVAALALVAVALAAIGFPLSKLWLGHQETPAIVQDHPEPAPAPASAPAPTPEQPVLPVSAAPEPAVVARAEAPVPPPARVQPAVPAASKPAASKSAATKPPVKTVRRPVAATRPGAAAPVSSPVAAAPAPEVAPPAPVAAPEPKPEAPAAPIGPFFELRDVNEVPRVLSRVEPQVPSDLRDRQLNEVVIVRVLVTQAGHPSMVNLLRRSKAGASLDEAIVAAVKQWTFVPAKRRGEAVSCWYHVGVPVAKAN
jgi:protein TonB